MGTAVILRIPPHTGNAAPPCAAELTRCGLCSVVRRISCCSPFSRNIVRFFFPKRAAGIKHIFLSVFESHFHLGALQSCLPAVDSRGRRSWVPSQKTARFRVACGNRSCTPVLPMYALIRSQRSAKGHSSLVGALMTRSTSEFPELYSQTHSEQSSNQVALPDPITRR